MNYEEIDGDLIAMGKAGLLDVICHGVNCFCKQANGLAPKMAKAFGTDTFPLESVALRGHINKLGQIDIQSILVGDDGVQAISLYVVNCYTQYRWREPSNPAPLDYDALTLCMRKLNVCFKGKHIGLPMIGAGLAGGDWQRIREIIKAELINCNVTVVIYRPI